ncbi:hypothetical protein [Paenibacillus sp. DYY-L-2]|uniref:hypothetical protein n=1 Tax=Paenibacillus sp. DYY-L-2 TaxID=3447013 RepID=UPI003F4F9353
MIKFLNGIGIVIIAGSLVSGAVMGFSMGEWGQAFWTVVAGILFGIIYIALAVILERVDDNRYYLEEVMNRLPEPERPEAPPKARVFAQSQKSALEALKGYKMNGED